MSQTSEISTPPTRLVMEPGWIMVVVALVSAVCGFVIGRSSSPEKVEQPVAQVVPTFDVTPEAFKAKLAQISDRRGGESFSNVSFESRNGRVDVVKVARIKGLVDDENMSILKAVGAVVESLGIEGKQVSPVEKWTVHVVKYLRPMAAATASATGELPQMQISEFFGDLRLTVLARGEGVLVQIDRERTR